MEWKTFSNETCGKHSGEGFLWQGFKPSGNFFCQDPNQRFVVFHNFKRSVEHKHTDFVSPCSLLLVEQSEKILHFISFKTHSALKPFLTYLSFWNFSEFRSQSFCIKDVPFTLMLRQLTQQTWVLSLTWNNKRNRWNRFVMRQYSEKEREKRPV